MMYQNDCLVNVHVHEELMWRFIKDCHILPVAGKAFAGSCRINGASTPTRRAASNFSSSAMESAFATRSRGLQADASHDSSGLVGKQHFLSQKQRSNLGKVAAQQPPGPAFRVLGLFAALFAPARLARQRWCWALQ